MFYRGAAVFFEEELCPSLPSRRSSAGELEALANPLACVFLEGANMPL